jgi:tetratricopeptide (TPR) repeat protein
MRGRQQTGNKFTRESHWSEIMDQADITALITEATARLKAGDPAPAYQVFTALVGAYRRTAPLDRVSLAMMLTNLSVACTDLGRDDEALAHSAEAWDLAVTAGNDAVSVAVLHNWGYAHKTAQRWSAALHGFKAAARLLEKTPDESTLDIASMLKEMSELLGWMEQPDEAFPLAYRCMTLRNGALGTTDALVGEAAQLAGRLQVQMNNQPKALGYLRPAYQIFNVVHGIADVRTVEAMHEMLSAAWKSGEGPTVEDDLRRLIPIARGLGVKGNPVYFRQLVDLAGVLEARGAADEARPLAIEGAGLLADLDGRGDRLRIASYLDLAVLLTRLGEPRAALPLMARAFRASDPLIDQAVATRDRFYRRRYLSRLSQETDHFISHVADHCADDPRAAADAFHFVVNRKGLHAAAAMAHDDAQLARHGKEGQRGDASRLLLPRDPSHRLAWLLRAPVRARGPRDWQLARARRAVPRRGARSRGQCIRAVRHRPGGRQRVVRQSAGSR